MSQSDLVRITKSELRRAALVRRDALDPVFRTQAAETVARRPFPVSVQPGTIVSGYAAMRSEINPLPLMRKLAEAGAQLALPVVVDRGKPLIMRAWSFGQPLVGGVWGILEPPSNAPSVDPDVLIVPLLAFDRRGYRLGYGAGYYDRTINALRARKAVIAVGLAFASQEVDAIPFTPQDARLDLVLTERESIDCRGAR